MTKHGPPYSPDEWIKEIPFDVAEWGDKPLGHPDGLFKNEKEYQAAVERSKDLPTTPPLPGVPDKRAGDASTSPPMTPKGCAFDARRT